MDDARAAMPVAVNQHDTVLALCHELARVGIWLYVDQEGALTAGPPMVVHQHPALLHQLRAHKAAIVQVLETCLAVEIFGTASTDTRFAREICPDCQRSCHVIFPPRRLEVHRAPDGQRVCPGSERAQAAVAQTILTAFIADRCVQRPQSVLTWYALRGALQAWCHQRGWLLPPRPTLLAWLDAHYERLGDDDVPRWAGLTLTIEEWLGDEHG